jgi:hypothetical protein
MVDTIGRKVGSRTKSNTDLAGRTFETRDKHDRPFRPFRAVDRGQGHGLGLPVRWPVGLAQVSVGKPGG